MHLGPDARFRLPVRRCPRSRPADAGPCLPRPGTLPGIHSPRADHLARARCKGPTSQGELPIITAATCALCTDRGRSLGVIRLADWCADRSTLRCLLVASSRCLLVQDCQFGTGSAAMVTISAAGSPRGKETAAPVRSGRWRRARRLSQPAPETSAPVFVFDGDEPRMAWHRMAGQAGQ